MGRVILWGPGHTSIYDARRAAELIAVLALVQGACLKCGWALKRGEIYRGCPACGEIFFEFNGELVAWSGDDASRDLPGL